MSPNSVRYDSFKFLVQIFLWLEFWLENSDLKISEQASTYQLREEVDDAALDTGPLGAIQRLQGLSNRTPSQVLQSWKNLTIEERHDIEQPSALWIVSVDKTHNLSDLDIVSKSFKSPVQLILYFKIPF